MQDIILFIVAIITSLGILTWSADRIVIGAPGLAQSFAVSPMIIDLTIVAIGTSLPELAAMVAAVRKGEHDIAIGAIVGSNLFNILAVLGISGVIGMRSYTRRKSFAPPPGVQAP